jgi:photosystem II stability/assembly factor-like uncharacterized protein
VTAAPSATELPIIEIDTPSSLDPTVGELIITEIHMTSVTSGWALASRGARTLVLHSSDGGTSWQDVTPPIEAWSSYIASQENSVIPSVPQLGDGTFLDDHRAWISTNLFFESDAQFSAAAEVVLSTEDSGATWRIKLLPEGLGAGNGRFIGFIDPLHGWFTVESYAGAGGSYTAIYRTTDGGESWELVLDEFGCASCVTENLAFGDATTGVMTFERSDFVIRPYVRWTHDGGMNWGNIEYLPEPEDPSTSDPTITDFTCGTAFPHAFSQLEVVLLVECRMLRDAGYIYNKYIYSNFLYLTNDGGLSWRSSPAPSGSLYLLSPSGGWMLGEEIFSTENAGLSWTKVNNVTWDGQFNFVDALHGWAVARNANENALVKTENGGQTWTIVEPRLLP